MMGDGVLIEIFCTPVFIWLFIKVFGLAFKVAWSLKKIIAMILFVMVFPALIVCFIIAGGFLLLIPVAFLGLALALLNA